jgi:hypothetical protein
VEGVKPVSCIIAASVLLSSQLAEANECIPPKLAKISGALCGRLIDSTGAFVPDIELRVVDDSGGATADTQADSKADFIFPALVRGKRRLTTRTVPWLIEFGVFAIKTSQATGTEPMTVRLDTACCCFGSGIINRKPSPD